MSATGVDDKLELCSVRYRRALKLSSENSYDQAIALLDNCAIDAMKFGFIDLRVLALRALSDIYVRRGELMVATRCLEEAFEITSNYNRDQEALEFSRLINELSDR